MSIATMVLAHIGGIPVEEALVAGALAGGAGLRLVTLYLRQRQDRWRSRRGARGETGAVASKRQSP